jgi:ribosomal protein L3
MAGILGKKIGMTQLYRENLEIAVTAIEAGPCCVIQIKTVEKDKYNAVQIGFGEAKKLGKAEKGHLKENGNYRYLRELRTENVKDYQVGQKIDARPVTLSRSKVFPRAKGLPAGSRGIILRVGQRHMASPTGIVPPVRSVPLLRRAGY